MGSDPLRMLQKTVENEIAGEGLTPFSTSFQTALPEVASFQSFPDSFMIESPAFSLLVLP